MKYIVRKLIPAWLILIFILQPGYTRGLNPPDARQKIQDVFTAVAARQNHLEGYLGEKVDLCIRNRVSAQDVNHLIEPFKHREETRLWQSEFWGKWITSAIGAYEYNQDPHLLSIIKSAVRGLSATQTPDGYIGNYADESHLREWDIWGRKYTLLGLLAYYDLSKDGEALKTAIRLADHLLSEVGPGKADIVQTGNYRGMPSSSILEPVVLLYKYTGEERFLAFAEYIVRQWETPEGPRLISKGLAGIDVADRFPKPSSWWSWENGQKAYEMMSCYEGMLELYRVTGETLYLESVRKTVRNIIDTEINIAGSGSAIECWYHGKKNQIFPAYHTMETCVTMTWMKLCENLLRLTGDPVYADQIELSTYNALLASMLPDGSWFAKYSPLEGRRAEGENQCGMNINCCVANGPRAIVMLPAFAVMKSSSGIAVNLYCQSESTIRLTADNTVRLKQVTDYPVSGRIRMELTPEMNSEFSVSLRIPGWSGHTTISVNGEPVDDIHPGTYREIKRIWKKGDQLELDLDMHGRMVETDHQYAVLYGPVVLARDTRFNDGDVDETSAAVHENETVELVACPEKPDDMWMCFTAPLIMGTNLEDQSSRRSIHFCDYASAGNNWSYAERYRVWLNETWDVKK